MPVNIIPPQPWSGRDDPEDGEGAVRLHNLVEDDASRAVFGFACDAGVARNKGRTGAHDGPAALRTALANLAAPKNITAFSDLGDIEVIGNDLEAGQAALADTIDQALGVHDRLVVFGGGHETAFGSFTGLRKRYPDSQIGIINLDAHLDLRLVGEAGPSSGTPFAQIRDLDPGRFDYLCLGIAAESNTAALMSRAHDWSVNTVSDHDLIADGHAADQRIDEIIERSDIIYLTIDIDVLPHFQAPGVSAPAARGVPLAAIEHIVGHVLAGCRRTGTNCPLTDIVELSPPNDRDNVTARTAALLIRTMLFEG
ncbi:formimidoylglutamase [Parasphingopyxis sp. CP4]|uniref:formimidoylglutamase n=1 Tax=Parasphingopyxis sp. CP4 TaxID=2724527 RepID=UPI0015A3B617|nr:formimidoylglutamase [Parasphingopyxis sp. CP4]QLC21994.1 formimidoylglutamase [Parasphingopyxis sp. CP4]